LRNRLGNGRETGPRTRASRLPLRRSGSGRGATGQGAEAPAEYALLAIAAEATLDLPSENNVVARTDQGMIRAGDIGPDEVRK
jgi:hypothetical protein